MRKLLDHRHFIQKKTNLCNEVNTLPRTASAEKKYSKNSSVQQQGIEQTTYLRLYMGYLQHMHMTWALVSLGELLNCFVSNLLSLTRIVRFDIPITRYLNV